MPPPAPRRPLHPNVRRSPYFPATERAGAVAAVAAALPFER